MYDPRETFIGTVRKVYVECLGKGRRELRIEYETPMGLVGSSPVLWSAAGYWEGTTGTDVMDFVGLPCLCVGQGDGSLASNQVWAVSKNREALIEYAKR